jgi:hypothetical protein
MNEQANAIETTTQPQAAEPSKATTPENKPAPRVISQPREVAAVVMARMHLVRAKKEELNVALNGLVDITQQLTRAYAEQLTTIEQLRRRVKELEGAPATATADPAPAVQ